MNKERLKELWKAAWPHVVIILVFHLLLLVYFAPEVFSNKQLPQGDVISCQGWGRDAQIYHEQTGEYAHWSNSMFGGMPHNYTYTTPSKSIFHRVHQVLTCYIPKHTVMPLLMCLLGFYIFMLCMGCSPWLSAVGAFAYAFASYNIIIIDAGHVTKAEVIASIPAVIAGVKLCYDRKYVWGILLTLFATGMNIYWSHQQISYYTILMLLGLAVAYLVFAIREKDQKHYWLTSLMLVGIAALAFLPALDKQLPTLDYSKESMRGGAVLKTNADDQKSSGLNRDYAFAWSYGVGETMTLLIPNYYGASSNYPLGEDSQLYKIIKKNAGASSAKQFVKSAPTYWGDQPFTSGPVYAGAIICFLFILGLLVVPHKERWWLLVAVITGVVLSWGRNFPGLNNWLFDHLPLYNKFRTPSMALVMTTTAMAMLAFLALKEVLDRKVSMRQVLIAGGISAGLCLLFAIFPGIAGDFTGKVDAQMPDWVLPALIEDRRHMLTADAWRSFLFITLGLACVAAYLKMEKLRGGMVVAVVGVLVLVDLWTVDKRFLNDSHFVPKKQVLVAMTDIDKQILADKTPDYRVLNLARNTFNESQTSYYHQSVGGYSPAKLQRYQDIIDYYLSGKLNPNVLNMLNTRYVITRQGVQANPAAFGNCWFVNNVQFVNNPNEEIEAIADADLKATAFMDTCWQRYLPESRIASEGASIRLINYANPGEIVYESHNPEAGVAVFSEVYYKTWKAFIDGAEVPVLRANYILRALAVPAGEHVITFKCRDEVLINAQRISVASSALIVLVVLGLLGGAYWKKRKSAANV